MQEEIRINQQRISFPKKIKRSILLEISRGMTPKEAFLKHAVLNFEEFSNDKKYLAKLLYKWRQELYANKNMLLISQYSIDNNMLLDEIANMGTDDEDDELFKVLYEKYIEKQNSEK